MVWFAYAVIQLGSAVLWGVISGWLLYFYLPPGQSPLVSLGLFSIVMLVSKAVNILLGLPIGYISDHTNSSWGRRLPYIIGGAFFLPILFYLLWTPPDAGESTRNLIYLTLTLVGFNIAYETHQITYEALLPELAVGEKDRVAISTWKMVFLLGGNILAGFAGPLIDWLGYVRSMQIFAAIVAPIIILPGFFLRNQIEHTPRAIQKIPFVESFKITLRNRNFQVFALGWGMMWASTTLVLEIIPFIVTEICSLTPSDAAYFYLPAIATTLIAFPFVTKLSAEYGAKAVFRGSLFAGAICTPLLMLIGNWIPIPLLAQGIIWMVLQSASLAGAQILPSVMVAEITDVDEVLTGQRREGSFYSVWGLLNQIFSGLATAAIPLFLILGRSKLDPQGPLGVRLLGLVGGLLLLASFFVFRKYKGL